MKISLLIILIFLALSVPSFAHASDTTLVLAEAKYITLDEAVANVKKDKSTKVLSAETVELDGQPTHLIKILTKEGRVKKIHVPTTPNN